MRIIENLQTGLNNLLEHYSSHEDQDVNKYIQVRFGDDILEVQGSGPIAHVKTMTEKVTIIKKGDGSFTEIVTPRDQQ